MTVPQWIVEDLIRSGLTLESFTVEPLQSEQQLVERLGFRQIGDTKIIDVGAYWIPYPNVQDYYRLKLVQEIKDSEGDKIKYLSPRKESGKGNHAYIVPEVEKILKNYNPDKPIYITEGEKKAVKATLEGFPCIGLSGVSCYKNREDDFLPELNPYSWKDRTTYIVFDSDIVEKFQVKLAELRLTVELTNRGARVYSVRLPNEENGTKNGLDDYLVRYGKEGFSELVKDAKPTLELCIDGDMRTERIIEQIAKLKSESDKDKWVKRISEKRGISHRAINKELKKYEQQEENEEVEKKYTAYFPELVDLVQDENGNVAFLVKEGKELAVKSSVVIDCVTYLPPPFLNEDEKKLFKFIPLTNEVIRHYKTDSDSAIYADLVAFHKLVSELPNDKFYELIAVWVLHTYLLENFEYSPYIWLFAIPEKGKTRTGKGVILIAYRGVHIETLRDAHLIRLASDWKATIFIDVMDLWQKAEKAGSQDFLLQRHERGAVVLRVNYPERGAFEDTVLYDIFGPTFIATNEGIHPALESRAILITMKEASKEFGDIPLDLARSLKERLVAFRARHLGKGVPQIDKPARGRLGDILKPLMQIILLVAPGRKEEFRKLISELDQDRKAQKSESTDAKLTSIIVELEDEVEEGLLRCQKILDAYNDGVSEKFKISDRSLGWKLKALGFPKKPTEIGKCIIYDKPLLDRLMARFGLRQEEQDSKPPSDNDKSSSPEDISPDVFREREETSAKRQPESADKHWSADNPYVPDVSPEDVRGNTFSDCEIEEITYATGDIVYKIEAQDKDGKLTIHIITPDCPEFEDIRKEYEQQSR